MRDELWIKHDARSRLDPKMARFLKLCGMAGYGIFWAIIEILHYQNDHQIDLDSELQGIADMLNLSGETLQGVVDSAIAVGLFRVEGRSFFQARLKQEQAERSRTKQTAGRLGGLKSGEVRRSKISEKNEAESENPELNQYKSKQSLEANEATKLEEREERDIEEDTNVSSSLDKLPKKVDLAPKISMTQNEIQSLITEFGKEACAYYKNICSDWLVANGKTKKNSAAFMRNWIRKEIAERKGFYYPKPSENGYKPHTAANTAEKNFKYLENQYGAQGVADMFNTFINGEKKSGVITVDGGSVVPVTKKP